MLKRISLLILIILPYLALIKATSDFFDHYAYLSNLYFYTMKSTYMISCKNSKCVENDKCVKDSSDYADSLKNSLDKIK